ncbi:hypothetical protein MANY_48610 [Mycolicibacterium anyangense]|uniref:Uncharacterized protein n=1 Tax=Mycolicibacterium anyangense TaxID=1431246 RepID=A0A6N4WHJ7_9MYCO|nr:hypothetical protein MANY_48610 [Mycolicibacterium anyangense]
MRVTVSPSPGDEIDGAWWPHSGLLARELPALVDALRPVLGEIVDIALNWSANAGAPVLKPLSSGSMSMLGWNDRRQRLVLAVGRTAQARLLVVPHSTTPALGRIVLRRAASMALSADDLNNPILETADCVLRAAKAESVVWRALPGALAADSSAV